MQPNDDANDKQIKVSFIIVNWNVKDYIVPCLQSIYKTKPEDVSIEVIVVDNASSDGPREYLPQCCPQAKLIFSDKNLGYGPANNLGFEHSTGEYLYILNPDTEFKDSSWTKLIETLDSQPEVGMAGPTIYFGDGSIQAVCARRDYKLWQAIVFELFGVHRWPILRKLADLDKVMYAPKGKDAYVDGLCGAAMLIRRELYDRLGGFDTDYIHGGEDADLCIRCRKLGFKVKYVADSSVNHYHNKSGEKAAVATYVKRLSSNETFFIKQYGRLSGWIYRKLVLLLYCPRLFIVFAVAKLSPKKDTAYRKDMLVTVSRWALGIK